MTLTWLELSKLPVGTRVRFADTWDIFAEDVWIPEGTTGTITENGLNEIFEQCAVLTDNPEITEKLEAWEGEVMLSPPNFDRRYGNRDKAWYELSPLEVLS